MINFYMVVVNSYTPSSSHFSIPDTALFFAVYSVISAVLYVTGVRTKYHRLIAEERERNGALNYRTTESNIAPLPVL